MALQQFQNGFRLMAGEWFAPLINAVNTLMGVQDGTGAASVTNLTQNGLSTRTPQIAVAAGSNSQANSVAITKSNVVITTVSATTRGFRLPAAATGLTVQVNNMAATAVKPYPATGDLIAGNATNAVGTAVAAGAVAIFTAVNSTRWLVK